MQDYFSVDKTENGKKFVSKITDAGVSIFQDNSLLRMESNQPPGIRRAIRGKKLSMSRYAKQFTKNLFIAEKIISNNGVIIRIGIDIPTGIIPPAEEKYKDRAGHFSSWLESLGIYNFAGVPAQNIFFIRHFGSGTRGTVLSYLAKRVYPNNLNLLGPSGALLSSDTVRYHIEAAVNMASISDKAIVQTEDKNVKVKLVKRNKITGEIVYKSPDDLKVTVKSEDEGSKASGIDFANDSFLAEIVKQVSEENVDDFLKGNFNNVKLAHGSDLLMWHPGVPPYDWFNNTNYGKTKASPFQEDLEKIEEMIQNAYIALAGKI